MVGMGLPLPVLVNLTESEVWCRFTNGGFFFERVKMKKLLVLVLGLSLFVMGAFANEAAKVELKDVPKEVLDAAKEKSKGLEAKEVTVAAKGEGKAYSIKGTAEGKEVTVEVVVDKAGKVTKEEPKKEEVKK